MSNANLGAIALVPLFKLLGANMQSTSDQAFVKQGAFTNYVPVAIIAQQASGGTSVACVGGIYPSASKGGTPIVAAAQSWVTLTTAGVIVNAALASVVGTNAQTATPFLSLTTGSTAAATADFYVFGYVLGG